MVNSSVKQKDIGFKTQPGPVAKMQLQGLRLGIEHATLDLWTNALRPELQKPLPWAWVRVPFG